MRIGTRGSALALWQARWVQGQLEARGTAAEIVEITTAGDRGERLTDKSRWTSELELALLEQRIDVAVHSAKDVPGELAAETVLAAVCAREDPRDAICGVRSITELQLGARVGTGSLRRAAQLRAQREDLVVVPVRGNVDTRLRKLRAGEVDALVLALAGIRRLGREDELGGTLDFVPAAGQGALALQARADEAQVLSALSDRAAAICVICERELTLALGASCNTAVGANARLTDTGEIELSAWLGLPDGSEWISDSLTDAPETVAGHLAHRLITVGALELLRRAEAMVEPGDGAGPVSGREGRGEPGREGRGEDFSSYSRGIFPSPDSSQESTLPQEPSR